ncbi:aBC-type transport system permease component [Faecalibacterium sp. CAG:1138]|nr:aBC-type transport system permease component [Faecalibacterium sp. CAG:1138]
MVDSKKQWKAWLYLAPAIVLLLIFTVWPIINTFRLAFLEKYNEMEAIRGVTFKFGLANFKFVLKWKWFMSALKNTMLLTVVTVPISTILALLIAVALNSIGPLKRLLQTIFFLPYVTNSIAIGMVFAAMFNIIGYQGLGDPNMHVEIGIINKLLGLFGAEPINWINPGSSWVANFTVMVIYIVWNALPFKILILLGGLQSINKQYYDAAKVDGTSKARILTRITVPLLSPMIAYVVITGFIGGFKEYSSIVGVFGEFMGPQVGSVGSMITIVGLIYKVLPDTKYGYASAAALVLFAIIMVITLINLQVSKKRVHY